MNNVWYVACVAVVGIIGNSSCLLSFAFTKRASRIVVVIHLEEGFMHGQDGATQSRQKVRCL